VVLKKILLTGATGLLGRHVLQMLIKYNYNVIATSRKKIDVRKKNVIWKKLDLSKKFNYRFLDEYFGPLKSIIHVGAHVPGNSKKKNNSYIKNCNIKATEKLTKWATKRKIHFIYISGAIVYKNQKKINSENSKKLNFSKNAYCNSKIICEKKILSYKNKGLNLTIFRPSSIYGWGLNSSKVISKILNFSKKNKTIKIYNVEETFVNLIHAHDVSRAIIIALKKRILGIYNLGNFKLSNFYDIARESNKLHRRKKKIELIQERKIFLIKKLNVNFQKAKKFLNWIPGISLRKGLFLTTSKKCS